LSRDRGIPWSINGVTFRVDPHHRHRLGVAYDAPVAAFLRERIQPGDICLDIGANVGVYVLQLAHWSRPNGRVIAFEPNPAALDVLRKHVRFNGLEERVRVVAAAVGAASGESVLYAADADGMSRLETPNPALAARARPFPVPVVTIDEYCAAEGIVPDWIVIDVEGFELSVLSGGRAVIANRIKPPGVIVEMHPSAWAWANASRGQAEFLIAELGLRAIPLTGQTDPFHDHGLVRLVRD
jgi:FkbM family methyltransferase